MNKLIGIVLLITGALFTLAFIGALKAFIFAIQGLTALFQGNLNAYGFGKVFGQIFYWALHISLIYFTIKYGLKFLKKDKITSK